MIPTLACPVLVNEIKLPLSCTAAHLFVICAVRLCNAVCCFLEQWQRRTLLLCTLQSYKSLKSCRYRINHIYDYIEGQNRKRKQGVTLQGHTRCYGLHTISHHLSDTLLYAVLFCSTLFCSVLFSALFCSALLNRFRVEDARVLYLHIQIGPIRLPWARTSIRTASVSVVIFYIVNSFFGLSPSLTDITFSLYYRDQCHKCM
jgi:hypothetical protein